MDGTVPLMRWSADIGPAVPYQPFLFKKKKKWPLGLV